MAVRDGEFADNVHFSLCRLPDDEGGARREREERAVDDTRRRASLGLDARLVRRQARPGQAHQVSEGLAQGDDFDLEDVEITLGWSGRSRAPRSSYVSQNGPLSAKAQNSPSATRLPSTSSGQAL